MPKRNPPSYQSLPSFHRQKIFIQARAYRNMNHSRILPMIQSYPEVHGKVLNPKEPPFEILTTPYKWDATHWAWFTILLIHQIAKEKGVSTRASTRNLKQQRVTE